jgi:hypothetical protein
VTSPVEKAELGVQVQVYEFPTAPRVWTRGALRLFDTPFGSCLEFPTAPRVWTRGALRLFDTPFGSCLEFPTAPRVWTRGALRLFDTPFGSCLECRAHSHSMVEGGFEETSYTTRLMPRTSLTMRLETLASSSWGRRAQSAVMPSADSTARRAIVNW